MINVLLNGCSGKMGSAVIRCVNDYEECKIIAGVDVMKKELGFPVYESFDEVKEKIDVIIDFSNPVVLDAMLDYAVENKIPVVICTTGYSKEQIQKINEASKIVPVFFSGNMSLGINVLIELCRKAASVFSDKFDVEIIEKHHNQKLDAPSGTALMIADGLNEVYKDKEYVYDRHERREKRPVNEIGIHSLRGGTIIGEHEVIFAGHDEVVSIRHQAQSKYVFANGAVKAAMFIIGKSPKMYEMSDMLK